MEKLILILFTSMLSCGSYNLQNVESNFDKRIVLAYNYVSEKYDSKIIVSNSFADIDIVNFAEDISKKQSKQMSVVLDSLIKAKEEIEYKTRDYPIKNLVKNKSRKGNLKLFFSEPKKDYIMVEVFETEENKDYDKLTMFGSSDVYLLYFNGKEIIDKHQIKLDYN